MGRFKTIPIYKLLEKKYGGKWKYDRKSGDFRDELGGRTIRYTASFYEDEMNYNSEMYLYYDDLRPTERVFL